LSGITLATFTDGAGDSLGNYTATITWGDPLTTPGGNSSPGVITTDGAGNFTVTGSHTYVVPALARLITVKIVDSDGSKATVFSHAKVADAPITATALPMADTVNNSTFIGNVATFTDADPNATASPTTDAATINWGDGFVSKGSITQDPNTKVFTVAGVHHYAVGGVPKAEKVTTIITDRGVKGATAIGSVNVIAPFPTTTPSMVHDYTGNVNISLGFGIHKSFSFEIIITNQTLTSLTGQILIDGTSVANGTLSAGVIGGVTKGELSNGNFIFTYSGSASITISGSLSKTGTTITNGLITASNLPIPGFSKITGSFTMTAVS